MTATKTTKNATTAAVILAAEAPSIQLANPKPLEAWQPDPFSPARPSAEWDAAKLGHFAANAARRSAEHAWELGRALFLAKDATKKEGIKWEEWTQQYVPVLNERTRQRYMKLGRLDYDDIKGKGLDEVYRMIFGAGYAGKKTNATNTPDPTPDAPPATDSTTQPTDNANTNPEEAALVEKTKAVRLQEAIDTLLDLTTAPDEWTQEIEAKKADLANIAYGIFGVLKIGAK